MSEEIVNEEVGTINTVTTDEIVETEEVKEEVAEQEETE